jgi:phosphoribosylanthranilate isomerase
MMTADVQIKICGLSEQRHVRTAVEAGAGFVGFVFYGPSPRNVSIAAAQALAAPARGRAKIVALVVDADDGLIDAINTGLKPDYFQLHGSETPERCSEVQVRTGVPVIKAIKVRELSDIEGASAYAGNVAIILFDAKAPETLDGALPGGNGLAFDWTLLSRERSGYDFMLSGGLDAGNVGKAIDITGAPMVDVSSGVESAPGRKDDAAIIKFIEAVRQHG